MWQIKKKNIFLITALTFFIADFLLIACESKKSGHDELVVIIDTPPESLDPRYTLTASGQRVAKLIHRGLFTITDNSEVEPDLLKKAERISDTQYRFFLKENQKFHDQSFITTEDISYTFESILDEKMASPFRGKFHFISHWVKTSSLTIDLFLKEPYGPLFQELEFPILSHIAARQRDFKKKTIGNGPFQVQSWDSDEELVLKANDNSSDNNKIKQIRFLTVSDENTRILKMIKGEADVYQYNFNPAMIPLLEKQGHLKLVNVPSSDCTYIVINFRDPILSQALVRKAIAYAINKKAIIQYKFYEKAVVANSLLDPKHWAYFEGNEQYLYSPQTANQLLDEAGFFRDEKNKNMRFSLRLKTSTNRIIRSVALILREQLREVGIDLQVESSEFKTFFHQIGHGNFQMGILTWTPVIDPHLYAFVFHSRMIPSHDNQYSGANRGAYINQDLDNLLDKAGKESRIDVRREYYRQVQSIVTKELPYIYLWHNDRMAIVKQSLGGYELSRHGFFSPLVNITLEP